MTETLELKRINDFVDDLLEITNVIGSYVYGIDSNGNSVKMSIDSIKEYACGDLDVYVNALFTKVNSNTNLLRQLQTALEDGKILNIKGFHTLLANETPADFLGTVYDAEDGDLWFVGDGVNDNEEYVKTSSGWQMLGGISRAETEAKIKVLRDNVQVFVNDITVIEGANDADFTLVIPDAII